MNGAGRRRGLRGVRPWRATPATPGRHASLPPAVAALLALLLVLPSLAACTPDTADPERAATVVVAVDTPLASLNAGLPEGRTAGSTLVRGLVTDGFVALDEAGTAVFDPAFGTVEKLSDDPLTVRYTVSESARWSDGEPVTPADLLLEWAARSGRFDEPGSGETTAPPGATTPAAVAPASGAAPGSTVTLASTAVLASAVAPGSAMALASAAAPASMVAPASAAVLVPAAAHASAAALVSAVAPASAAVPVSAAAHASAAVLVPAVAPASAATSRAPTASSAAAPSLAVSVRSALAGTGAVPRLVSGEIQPAAPAPEPTDPPDTPLATLTAPPSGPSAPAGDGAVPTGPTPTPRATQTPSSESVDFGAQSAALAVASALPTIDGRSLTLVYDHPVPDWQVALDVGLPAQVVGRLALGDDAGADDVTRAIVDGDRAALAQVSQVWRTGFDVDAIAADPTRAVTTGPYRLASLDVGRRVELVPNTSYGGSRPAARERVVVRWDLGPLEAVDALRAGDVDVVAPVSTPEVTAALARVPEARVHDGGGAVFQLVLNEAAGPFEMAAPPLTTTITARRATFVAAVPREELARGVGGAPSSAVLATLGPGAVTDPPLAAGGASDLANPIPVRVLVATGDPVRSAMLDQLTAAASAAGFVVTAAQPQDPETALWSEPGTWDAALVPVPQAELPVAATIDRWRTGGATNVSGHADGALDDILDTLARTADPATVAAALGQVGTSVRDARVVIPLVRQPSVVATVDRPASSPLPRLGDLAPVPWGDEDLAPWWSWAVTGTG